MREVEERFLNAAAEQDAQRAKEQRAAAGDQVAPGKQDQEEATAAASSEVVTEGPSHHS